MDMGITTTGDIETGDTEDMTGGSGATTGGSMITTGGSMVSDGIKTLFGILIKTIMLGIKIITIHTTNNLTTIGLETLIEIVTIGKIPSIVETLITEEERLATLLTEKTNLLIQELQEEEVEHPLIKNWKKQ